MRRVILGSFVSIDGVMQAPGGPEEDPTHGFTHGGWTFPHWDEIMGEAMGGMFGEPYDLLLGRKTYEIFAAHWPYQNDDPIGEAFNRVAKYVVTSSGAPLAWNNSHALHGDPAKSVAELKASNGPNLLIQGSSVLVPALFAAGLIDRVFLMTFPVVLGQGKRLFGEGTGSGALRMIDSKVSTTGVLMATYEPAGEVKVGSFAHADPSAEEVARRERIKAEG